MKKLLLLATLFLLFSARAWAANTYDGSTKFNINVSTNVAGLTALKGGAPALTDYIWISEAATLTIESGLNAASIYIGENSGATAVVDLGYVVAVPGITLTIGTNILHEGMSGKYASTGSAWYFECTAALPCTITDANVDKWSSYGGNSGNRNKIIATYTTFEHFYGLYLASTQTSITDSAFLDCNIGLAFITSVAAIPESLNNNTFTGCGYAIYHDGSGALQWTDYFVRNKITLIGTADGINKFLIAPGSYTGLTRYPYILFSSVPIARHKCLGKNCRLGGL